MNSLTLKNWMPTTIGMFSIAALLSGGTANGAWFQGLGHFPDDDLGTSWPRISADGSTVAGTAYSGSTNRAFRWTRQDGFIALGSLPGGKDWSSAYNISADGSTIVGSSSSADGSKAFRWTAQEGMVGLDTVYGPRTTCWANGVSSDGKVISGAAHLGAGSGMRTFRWTEETGMFDLGSSRGYGMSADGSTIVGIHIAPGRGSEGFRWTADTGVVSLGGFPDGDHPYSWATTASADGSTIVGEGLSVFGYEAFRWSESTGMQGLGSLAPEFKFSSMANDVSADGSVIVGHSISGRGNRSIHDWLTSAFVWDEINGIQNLEDVLTTRGIDFTGWTLRIATGVSADGQVIVGHGINPEGRTEAWIANLRDEEPPVIEDASASSTMLWPPNNKLVRVGLDALVTDDSGEAIWGVVGIECNEPGTEGDMEVLDDHTVNLRASRSGHGDGRIYTVWLQAMDSADNLSELFPVDVIVPHDKRYRR